MRLTQVGERRREYDRCIPARTEHVVAGIGVFKCESCGEVTYARPGDVLRRMSYSNSFLAAGTVKFYVQGHTADDGECGTGTAPAKRTPLGECRAHEGRTVVTSDRFSGYSPLDVRHQYCFGHLRRDLNRLLDDFPGNDEVKRFHDALRPLLAESMGLCADKAMPDGECYGKAQELKEKIREVVFAEARDHGVQGYQNIWREKWDSLFAWVEDRRIKCDNNAAERAIRPTVIARKISMGSQGAKGVRNREIITSVLMTVKIRGEDPYQWLVNILDALARNPEADVAGALPEPDVTLREKRRNLDKSSQPA